MHVRCNPLMRTLYVFKGPLLVEKLLQHTLFGGRSRGSEPGDPKSERCQGHDAESTAAFARLC